MVTSRSPESARNPAPQQINSAHETIIVGAGLAGLFTALKLAPRPVTVIASKALGDGASSLWAQGGIAAAIGEGDTAGDHAADTIKAGAGLVDEAIAHLVTSEASDRIHDLLQYGVPFDQDLAGRLQLSKEAAHGTNRIVRVSGDQAGAAIMAALIKTVRETPSISILEGIEVHELSTENGTVNGVFAWPAKARGFGPGTLLLAKSVVLATGGSGYLYAKTTNPPMARGEGIAMAARAGAVIRDAEFVQFHPTAINAGLDPAPLATEALRGEGALLVNARGERIMAGLHPEMEMAPRDIVALAVDREIKAGRGAFLDCTPISGTHMKDHFKTVMEKCAAAGIDPLQQPIPIAPAAHFHMGGIVTDEHGRTSVDGLWACGETASTGLHGANRLASNSLLEAVVFAARIAKNIAIIEPETKGTTSTVTLPAIPAAAIESNSRFLQSIAQLRSAMFHHAGVERSAKGLEKAMEIIREIETTLSQSQRGLNMLTTAKFILVAALARTTSCGSHFRTDQCENDQCQNDPRNNDPVEKDQNRSGTQPRSSYLTLDEVLEGFPSRKQAQHSGSRARHASRPAPGSPDQLINAPIGSTEPAEPYQKPFAAY